MMSTAIPARLEFQCGHAALVSLPRVKGESAIVRTARVDREKSAAQRRACDFCGPTLEVLVAAAPPDAEATIGWVKEMTAIPEAENVRDVESSVVIETSTNGVETPATTATPDGS